MSSADITQSGETRGDGHAGAHPPFLAHHFDTPAQQFESGKLGMWVFLATEILMFGGLFCYYAYSRGNFPNVAHYSHHFLNPVWGAINTVVLLVSSFTMAWGVRAAQLGQKQLLVLMLVLTLAGGGVFMVIKAIEYTEKFSHGLYPGRYNLFAQVDNPPEGVDVWAKIHHLEEEYGFHGTAHAPAGPAVAGHAADEHGTTHAPAGDHAPAGEGAAITAAQPEGPVAGRQDAERHTIAPQPAAAFDNPAEHSVILPPAPGPAGLAPALIARPVGSGAGNAMHPDLPQTFEQLSPLERQRVASFFSIYYLMTGLHGLHVVIGLGLIGWILLRSLRGHFGPAYFTPVDIVGLYWHLVDLIWIFLFPLLYLID